MKKILIVVPQPFFTLRGTPINVRAVVSTLAGAGYGVTLLTLPFGDDLQIPGVKIVRIPKLPYFEGVPIGPSVAKLSYLLSFVRQTLRLTTIENFDLIHGIEDGAFAAGYVGLKKKIPYIVDVDSCMPSQLADSVIGKFPGVFQTFTSLERYYLERAAAAITVCASLTKKVNNSAPATPVFQIEDFPFQEALVVDETKLNELQQRFSKLSGRKILYTGNLESYQGVELLINAFKQTTEGVLIIVGGNSLQIAKLSNLAASLGVDSRIHFEGSRPASEMGAYAAFADILVSPRLYGENVPLKLYTYLAARKALVATKIASHTQIVDDSICFLGEPTQIGLASALNKAIQASESELKSIAEKGLHLVNDKYSETAFRERLVNAYSSILSPELTEEKPRMRTAISS